MEKMSLYIKSSLKLLRINQWYKGIVVFLGMVFGGKITDILNLDFGILIGTVSGFIILGLISSLNYIINDLVDIEKDKAHPEKSKRPLASGEISVKGAFILIFIIVILIVVLTMFVLDRMLYGFNAIMFAVTISVLFLNGVFYNFLFKKFVFIDILFLALNFIFRTMAGTFIAVVDFSPWLYILVYQVALFLAINKRISDLELLGENASIHKEVYSEYDREILKNLVQMMSISLFITYSLYCIIGFTFKEGVLFYNNRGFLNFSIPVALYIILRYTLLVKKYPEIARNPQKVAQDIPLVVAAIILVCMILIANYVIVDITILFQPG